MTTYNTYQEAKIANPDGVIYEFEGYFSLFKGIDSKECDPADHCMTVEKFLADGNKLEFTDVIVCSSGSVVSVANWIIDGVNKYYILRAAALNEKKEKTIWEQVEEDIAEQLLGEIGLEEKKPRTKVGYVKCEFSREWEAVKYYNEEGELFVIDCNGNYSNVNDISGAWYEVVCKNYHCIYRRIETPMTERDELFEALQSVWIIDGVDGQEQLEKIVDSGLFKLVS